MNKNILATGIVFLFVCSAFIPMSLGINTRITNTREQPSTFSRGKTLYVGGTGDENYTKIQDAIDNASDGDTVFVYNGTYYENVVVNKSINLIGEDKNTTIIDGNYKGSLVLIQSDNVTVSGFTIQESGTGVGIGSNDCKIIDNIIRYNGRGIGIGSSGKNNTIQNNIIIHNGDYGIHLFDIIEEDVFLLLITDNFIAHNSDCGISLDYREGVVKVIRNVIADNGKGGHYFHYGIWQHFSDGIFHHNDFHFNYVHADVDIGINSWDDGLEGNFWDDWEENPGFPASYIIEYFGNTDYHPNPIPYMDSLIVGLPPPYYAKVDEPINFSADITVDPYSVSWFWDFGDGNTSDEVYPSHSYDTTDRYHITVTVADNQGRSDTSKFTAIIGSPPEMPTIDGPTSGKSRTKYKYTISTVDPDGDDVYYELYPGYGVFSFNYGPFASGEELTVNLSFPKGTHLIRVRANDTVNLWSPEATLEVTMPRNRATYNLLFLRFLEQFPILERLLPFLF